jgi:hypothetical protein
MSNIVDFRIRFPSSLIDFNEDVFGESPDGQEINDFPYPGAQARYDWMRMIIIGLLANQSSTATPINYKVGTIWMNLNDNFYKYFDGISFAEIAKAIRIGNISLDAWATVVQDTVGKVTDEATFSGVVVVNKITEIAVPADALEAAEFLNNHPVLYKNGMLIDPRLTVFNTDRDKVMLLNNVIGNAELRKNDKYTVIIQRLDIVSPDTVVS